MENLEQLLSRLTLLREELGRRHALIVKTWDESVRQFELAVGMVSPDLKRMHLPWVVGLRQESVDESELVIEQLKKLERICQTLSQKPAVELQPLMGAFETTLGKIYQNSERIGRSCVERNHRLREFSNKLTESAARPSLS